MPDIAVLEDPATAIVALDPLRSRMLASLGTEPASAAGMAVRLGIPRQKVGYHLTALAEQGLVVEVATRRHGGLVERIFAASAASYIVSPSAMGEAAADPGHLPDRLSTAYLVALAARVVREVGGLLRGAEVAGQRLPTLSIDTDVRFRSAAERAAFADDLAAGVRSLVARYHDAGSHDAGSHDAGSYDAGSYDDSAPAGRWYRVVALAHPRPQEATPT